MVLTEQIIKCKRWWWIGLILGFSHPFWFSHPLWFSWPTPFWFSHPLWLSWPSPFWFSHPLWFSPTFRLFRTFWLCPVARWSLWHGDVTAALIHGLGHPLHLPLHHRHLLHPPLMHLLHLLRQHELHLHHLHHRVLELSPHRFHLLPDTLHHTHCIVFAATFSTGFHAVLGHPFVSWPSFVAVSFFCPCWAILVNVSTAAIASGEAILLHPAFVLSFTAESLFLPDVAGVWSDSASDFVINGTFCSIFLLFLLLPPAFFLLNAVIFFVCINPSVFYTSAILNMVVADHNTNTKKRKEYMESHFAKLAQPI